MKKKRMLLAACLLVSATWATAQVRVTGTVVSAEDGQPVVGASVIVPGTKVGSVTDINGKFTLSVPEGRGHLKVSSIGMDSQEVPVKPNVKIVLQGNAKALNELVVTAYGTTTKAAFTGSASVIGSEDIAKVQVTNAADALIGKVSGVQITNSSGQPGSTPSILIHGIGSITAGNSPLLVVDGAPFDGDLNNINPNDIASMSVLKDAASTALYGSRGANGVIMITTKKGQTRNAVVNLEAKWGSNFRQLPRYNTINDPAQYYEVYYGALKNYYENAGLSAAQAHIMANQNMIAYDPSDPDDSGMGLGYNAFTVPDGQFLIGANGKLNPNATLGRKVGNYYLQPDDWYDEIYKHSLRQEYNVSINGGSDRSTFYSSFGYLKNEGITPNSGYERLTARLKADYQAKPWLKVGANVSYVHSSNKAISNEGEASNSGNMFAIATRVAPIYPMYIRDANGNIMKDAYGNTMYDYGDGGNAGLNRPVLGNSNAVSNTILDTNKSEGNSLNATGFAEIKFFKDFKFTTTNTVYLDETRSNAVTNPYYGQYASSNGIVNVGHYRRLSTNYQQLLDYNKTIGLHNVAAMLGHEYYRTKYYLLEAGKHSMYDPSNPELAGAVITDNNDSYTTDYNTEGYFGRVQYNYNETYFATASYRRDASSRFDPEYRWGNFWSASAAWVISKESWFNASWVDMLKIRASYGSQGNDNIGNFRYTDVYDIVNSNGNPAAVPSTKGNKKVTWETNGNFNAGVDFSFFKGRLTGSADFFIRKTSDMLFSFPLPPSYGFRSYYANIGDMKNTGLEIDLNGTLIQTKDLNWGIHANLTYYKNKISRLPEERRTLVTPDGSRGFSSGSYFYGEGHPMYTYYIYKYAGVSETGEALYYADVKDANGNVTGQTTVTNPSNATLYLCGTALPDVYGGFGTTLNFKGFDFSVDFSYQLGGQVLDSSYASLMSSPTSSNRGTALSADILKAWTPENKDSNIPRFQYGDLYSASSSDRFLTSASYLNLQNITLGYTLPSNIARALYLSKLRVYFSADNVWLWSARQGLDPRQSITGSTTNTTYSPIRTLTGGISITF